MTKTINIVLGLGIALATTLSIDNWLSLKELETTVLNNTDYTSEIDARKNAINELSTQLALLKSDLQSIRTALSNPIKTNRNMEITVSSSINENEQSLNSTPLRKEENHSEQGYAGRVGDEAHKKNLDEQFDSESTDMQYSGEIQASLIAELQKLELSGEELQWLECRQTAYRMELVAATSEKNDELMFALAGALQNEFIAEIQVDDNGTEHIIVRMVRSE